MVAEMKQYIQDSQEDLLQLVRDLCAIPAPSHSERARAEFCKDWLIKAGGEGVYIDEALNVVCPVGVTESNPVVAFLAHTDTVFPDTTPLPFREDNEKIYCPGVCDDTANLAVLMICARYFLEKEITPKQGVLFVANSCEEGLGNLKGARQIVKDYGHRMEELISFDGWSFEEIVMDAVGSHRYEVAVKTQGGHSFEDFGNPNAIAVLAGIVSDLYAVEVPKEGESKTTYNVGIVSGGTSVNTIAQEAKMLYEYRSDNLVCLEKMEKTFLEIIQNYRDKGFEVETRIIGQRPCKGNVDKAHQQKMLERAVAALRETTGVEPIFVSGSTDCNIPLSMGIPAICVGVCCGAGIHTREEYLDKRSLLPGSCFAMEYISRYF